MLPPDVLTTADLLGSSGVLPPAPMVPAEVDLRGMPRMPVDVERLLSSELVALGTPAECWAAFMLWARSWQQVPAGSLPADDRVLAAFSGARGDWLAVRDMALRGWVLCSDGRLYHGTVSEAVLRAWALRERWQQRKQATAVRTAAWRSRRRPHSMPGDGEASGEAAGPSDAGGPVPPAPPPPAPPPPAPEPAAPKRPRKPKPPAPAFELPEWIPAAAWAGFEAMRQQIGKPLTPRAKELAVGKLAQLRDAGQDVGAVLDQSAFHSWQGLFAVKAEPAAAAGPKGKQTAREEGNAANAAMWAAKFAKAHGGRP